MKQNLQELNTKDTLELYVKVLKNNALQELKLRELQLKILPVRQKKTWAFFCSFTNDTINLIGKVIVTNKRLMIEF